MIHAEQQTLDLAAEGKVTTTVIGLRYSGPRSTQPPTRPRDAGGWPGRSTFQGGEPTARNESGAIIERDPGPLQIGIVPDTIDDEETVSGGDLSGLESLSDFEVVYDSAEMAQAILDSNFLPPVVFGGPQSPPDYAVREPVFEYLNIPDRLGTAPAAEGPLREALAETAGIDLSETEPPDTSRQQELASDHSRNELLSAAGAFDWSDDVDLRTASKSELAERLAAEPPGEVRAVLRED